MEMDGSNADDVRWAGQFERTGKATDEIDRMKMMENFVRTPELSKTALELRKGQPDISLRSFARELDVSCGTTHRLRHQVLGLSAYKNQTFQAMSNKDFTKRLDFGKFMLVQIHSGAITQKQPSKNSHIKSTQRLP